MEAAEAAEAADAADAMDAAEAADAIEAADAEADAEAEPFVWWSAAKAERDSREASSTTVVLDMTNSFYSG